MRNTHSFKMNLPEMSDPVDVRELNDNFLAIDDALMAGLCKKELTTNNMGSSDPASRKYGWAPWIEIYNGNEFDVVVIDRNAPDLPSGTINIEAGGTYRMFINGTYYLNFYVQDQHDVTFKWFTNAETRINEIEPSGGGGVSSVNVTGASGSHIESSGGPVTDTGTIELSISTGYSIPSDDEQTAWDSKAADLKLEINSSTFVITAQLKDASGNLIGNERTIDLPLETMVVDGEYDSQTQKIKLELKNGNYVEFSVADLVSGLQSELSSSNKLNPAYIDYDASHRAVSDTEKDTWNGKQNAIDADHKINADYVDGSTSTNKFVTASDKETWNAKQNAIDNSHKLSSDLVDDANKTNKFVTTTEKNTWNAKQNAIDADHKLSSSLVSFTTAEAAALASGIDSSKVGQISTNQTNILLVKDATKELVNKGTKNQWDFANATVSGGGGADRVTYTKSSNSIAITAVNSWAFVAFDVQLKAGTYYFQGLVSSITGSDSKAVTIRINGYDGTVIKRIEITTNGIIDGDFVVDTDRTITVSFYASEGTFTNSSYTISDLMICTKAEYDISSNYVPFALSNPILTPALIECVDNGAKNKFNPEKEILYGYVTDGNGYAFKSVIHDTRNVLTFVLLAYNNDTFVRELNSADIISTGLFSFTFVKSSDFNSLRFGHSGEVQDIKVYADVSDLVNGETYVLSFNATAINPSVLIAWNSTMICTKAKWDVSHNFEPHTLPNYDLTVRESEDRAALVDVVDKGAKNLLNLDDCTMASTDSGLTFTHTGNMLTISNTGTQTGPCALEITNLNLPLNTPLIISGCPSGGSVSTYQIDYYDSGTYPQTQTPDTGNGSGIVTFTSMTNSKLRIRISDHTPLTNKVFNIMVCTEADWKISRKYAPYTLPNTDLTRMMTPFFTVPINHNMIYRGQNLGDTLTADQDTALSSGNFTDLYLGDYWTKQITIPAFYEVTTAEPADWSTNYTSYYTKSGDTYTPVTGDTAPTWAANTYYERLVPSQTVTLKAVIADFDTFYAGYASSYAAINTHHAAVIVTGFNNVGWNKTNTTAGGYVNSLIHKWLVGSVLPEIETWFGSAKVLSHQKLLTNAITGDAASGWAWSSQKISLLSENQMYGSKVWGGSKATNGGYEPGEAFKHLNVFNHIDANLLFGNKTIWLRDITSAVWAAYLGSNGDASSNDASITRFAPAALILLS